MEYTSINNEKIKELKKLNDKKYRDEQNMFLIEGEHLVLEAHKAGMLKTLIKDKNTSFNLKVETLEVTEQILKSISTLSNPPKVIGVCNKIKEKEISNKILILDNIQDPGNLGTIIRSSVAFNIDTIVLSNDSVDLYNSKVIRGTQGMIFNVNIIRRNLFEFIKDIKKMGYKIIGTSVVEGKNIKKLEKYEKVAIIVGNEGNGITKELFPLVDENIYIKMNEKCESLNIGVATSIILYELDK